VARAKRAQVDLPVPRSVLALPYQRRAIRERAYRMLSRLGTIDESTIRFGRDPLDGPLAEQGLPDDETAVIRMSAMVAPRD